jgi:hypothetical protein
MAGSTTPKQKPTSSRASVVDSSTANASATSPTHHQKKFHASLLSALKKPFQGWSRDLLAAKNDLDDVYNFPHTPRRGEDYNFPQVKRRGEEDYFDDKN